MHEQELPLFFVRLIDKRERKRIYNALAPLNKYDDYWLAEKSDKENNEATKKELIEFFRIYSQCKPEKEVKITSTYSYYSFYTNFMLMRKAVIEEKYAVACHELLTICAFDSILQRRIYICLMGLYHDYLEESDHGSEQAVLQAQKDIKRG